MAKDDSNLSAQPEAEGSTFYAPPAESVQGANDRRRAVDPSYAGPERRKNERRALAAQQGDSKEYKLKSRAETIYPEAFIPVSKEFYEGLTKEQRDKLIRIQATAQEKVGYEKGAPKFFISDTSPADGSSPRPASTPTDPVADAAPRLVVGGALIGAGLLATGLSLAAVLPGGIVLGGSLLGLGMGIALALNQRG